MVWCQSFTIYQDYLKNDERILGDGDFVITMLAINNEVVEEAYLLRSKGVELEFIAGRVVLILEMEPDEI